MKRISILTAVMLLWLLAFGMAHGANEITLDAVTNSNGGDSAITGNSIPAGDTIKFTFRWTYEDGTVTIGASSNAFEVYEKNDGNFFQITWDTVSGSGLGSRFNSFFFQDFSVSGTGRDTISFGGYAIAPGVEIGYDSAVWYIETGSDNAGDTICIDSSFSPPGGTWLWSGMGGGIFMYPDWDGPHCFQVFSPSGDDLQTDSTSITIEMDSLLAADTVTIRVTSSGARADLDFTISADSSWISFDTADGTGPVTALTSVSPQDVLVIFDTAGTGWVVGSIPSATITITSPDAAPTTIPVNITIVTDVPYDEEELPKTYALSQNYPNPFNPSTEIKFELPYRSHVTLTVYNVLGQKVITLIDADMQAGRYPVRWEGTAGDGKEVASGVYFYKLEADDFVSTKKMMLLK